MRAAYLNEGAIEIVDVPMPSGNGELIKITATAICGSDLKLVRSKFKGFFGHEMSGTVDGARRVAIKPWNECGVCDQCQNGFFARCRLGLNRTFIQGGFAERIIVPAKCLIDLPPSLPLADACLVEPMAVAVHVIERIVPEPGLPIAIVGGGPIGLLCLAAARSKGADVALLARHDYQREAGEALGAKTPWRKDYPVVIEAGGTESAVVDAVHLTEPGGRLFLMGTQGKTLFPFSLYTRELTVVATFGYCDSRQTGNELEIAAHFLADHPEVPRVLITHRFPLEEGAKAFSAAKNRAEKPLKVVIEPR